MRIHNPVPLVKVRNVPRGVAFSRDALGATGTRTFPEDGEAEWAHPEAGEFHLMLLRSAENDAADLRAHPFSESPTVFYLMVDDADAAHRKLQERGFTVSDPEDMHYDTREFCLTDPDGHQIAIGHLVKPHE